MESRKERVVVIILAGCILVAATVTGTYLLNTGRLGGGGSNSGYKNVTFTDAVITCQDSVRSRFAERIISLEIDDHSSRYEQKAYLYKIFLKANMSSEEHRHGNMHYINCFVQSSNGRVRKLDVHEEVEVETEAVTGKPTNAFGWPK